MRELITSSRTMVILAGASGIAALADVLAGLVFALATHSDSGPFEALRIAATWVALAAWVTALIAIAQLGWRMVLETRWIAAAEIAGLSIAVLLLAISALIDALDASSSQREGGASDLAGAGFGILALLLLVIGGRRSVAEFRENVQPHRRTAYLWSLGAGAALLYAIAVGLVGTQTGLLVTAGITRGDVIAAGILAALCWLTLTFVVISAYRVGIARVATVQNLVVTFLIFTLSGIALTVAAATQEPIIGADLTGFRIAFSLPEFLFAVGLVVLAVVAASRAGGFSLFPTVSAAPPSRPSPPPPGAAPQPATPPSAPPPNAASATRPLPTEDAPATLVAEPPQPPAPGG